MIIDWADKRHTYFNYKYFDTNIESVLFYLLPFIELIDKNRITELIDKNRIADFKDIGRTIDFKDGNRIFNFSLDRTASFKIKDRR